MNLLEQVLIFCQATANTQTRSGIHRVTVELARALPQLVDTRLVRWDTGAGQLRFMDYDETHALFRGEIPTDLQIPLEARCVGKRFGDLLSGKRTHLLFPEIAYHSPRGNETLARIISQCREYEVPTSAIYYDAIPVTNSHYAEYSRPHVDYLTELVRFDHLFPISRTSGEGLVSLLGDGFTSPEDVSHFQNRIHPVLLPEGTSGQRASLAETAEQRNGILLVGTVEPRKQQLQVMQAINALRPICPAIADMRVDVVGSMHPAVHKAFDAEIRKNPKATFHNHVSDAEIDRLYETAAFTVFASYDEGYGLPIAESLVRGVPCLTANFGSMQEVADGGGCLVVDVNSATALQDGLRQMAEDEALRQKLEVEIAERDFRTWSDYAGDILAGMQSGPRLEPAAAQPSKHPILFASLMLDGFGGLISDRIDWTEAPSEATSQPDRVVAALWRGKAETLDDLAPAQWDALCAADVLGCETQDAFTALREKADATQFAALLPTRVVMSAEADGLVDKTHDALRRAAHAKSRRLKFAAEERLYSSVRRHFAGQGEEDPRILSLVISTYNRSPFVRMNTEWLAAQVARFKGKVDLTIVDNASTDDTWEALQDLASRPYVSLVQNPANVGMLGNLNVCSTLPLARHVWITGDDDFIMPEALDAVVAQLEANPGLSLGCVNFAVYHRQALIPSDTPRLLQSEGTPLGTDPAPDGIRRVCEIAAEHDNLFTAVYPIIFRSDILAACFNYPFQGIPFVDLVESVPTTKIILESYAQCEAYWFGDVGTVGNAHNSWSRHRPRWHALLMPLVFELAREAGVTEDKLRPWADMHVDLFEDALGIARDQKLPVHFDEPQDLRPGARVFLKEIHLPKDLGRWQDPSLRTWDGR